MIRFAIPLALFAVLVVILIIGLQNDPRYVPSPLIDKPAPAFSLPRLDNPANTFSPDALTGRVWLLNAWTSDCVACRQEHPLLMKLADKKIITLIGLNYRDNDRLAMKALHRTGNPYNTVVTDHNGRVGIDYGVYAVPETFVIDKKGVIRFKHIGPITPGLLDEVLIPLIQKLDRETV